MALGGTLMGALVSVGAAAQAPDAVEMTETEARAAVSVHPGWAEVVVRRAWHNPTPAAHRIDALVAEPSTGALVAASVGISADGLGTWSRTGRLLDEEAAMRQFRGDGGVPRGWAGLVWRDPASHFVRLLVDAVPPRGEADVEVRYLFPTRYVGGRHRFAIPGFGQPMRWVAEPSPEGQLTVDDGTSAQAMMARDGWISGSEVALVVEPREPLAGEYARVPVGDGDHLVRYHFALAPELGAPPRAPHVVLIVDRSRSRHPPNLERDRRRMIAYLDALPPDAKVEVIPFDRQPFPVFGRFVGRDAARQAVAEMSLERRHGSHLDRALAAAADRLGELAPDTDRRVVVLTDARMREAFSTATLNVGGALAHVVVSGTRHHPAEAEDHAWFPAIAETGGLVWFGEFSVDADSGEEHPLPAMSRLVRPTTLRRVVLRTPGQEHEVEERLDMGAGEGIERFTVTGASMPWVQLEGKIWSRPVRLRLRPNAEAGRRAAALALGRGFDLTPSQRRQLALHGGALSEHTSFVFGDPGARSAPAALRAGRGTGRLGRSHRARPPRVRSCGVAIRVDMDEAREQLRSLAEHAFARCGAPAVTGRRGALAIETTKSEIVDVAVRGLSKAQTGCVESALWEADLPDTFRLIEHERWDEDLSI